MDSFSRFVLDEIISHDEISNEIIAKVHSVSNPEKHLNVSVQEYSINDKTQGSEFEGILAVDYVLGFRECEDASLSYKLQNVVDIKAIVKVIEIVDECTIYAKTDFHDKLVRVEFEKKIDPRINSYIEIEGELHVMEKDNSIIELIRKC